MIQDILSKSSKRSKGGNPIDLDLVVESYWEIMRGNIMSISQLNSRGTIEEK